MFCKITNENENHNGFQYVDGLNILDKPFQDQECGSCVPGGLYYTDKANLHYFYEYGVWIRIVSTPEDAKVVEDPISFGGRKWRTDKIILHDKYPLYDLGTIKKFNLKITKEYIKEVSKLGKMDILEWWINSDSIEHEDDTSFQIKSMVSASIYGKINVLEFWKNSWYPLHNSDEMVDYASMYGQIEVLDWLKNLDIPYFSITYSENAIDYTKHVNVLDWWLKSNLPLKYSNRALQLASEHGKINVLEWWVKSGLPLKYNECALVDASKNGHVDVLQWWIDSNLPLKYNEMSSFAKKQFENLVYTCDDDVIAWWNENMNIVKTR
jgi:hypothetical protein